MDNESVSLKSPEVSYKPEKGVEGYRGKGFVETDHTSSPVVVMFETESGKMPAGEYAISFRYANGNGPVNTENKAAIRSLYVDGKDVGTIVMPQRGVGNWNDWGMSNSVRVSLEPGQHEVKLVFNPEDENMNIGTNHALIDGALIEKVSK